nr:type II toxin-antitoxin system HicB family antitoxin [uncultured Corynebacterium sp.]
MAERLSDKYTYQTFWSEEDGEYVSTIAEFPSLSWLDEGAQRSSAGLRTLVAEVVADMQQTGEPIPQPFGQRDFSGRFNVRVSSSRHRRLAMDAAREGVSLNAWVTQKLASA